MFKRYIRYCQKIVVSLYNKGLYIVNSMTAHVFWLRACYPYMDVYPIRNSYGMYMTNVYTYYYTHDT